MSDATLNFEVYHPPEWLLARNAGPGKRGRPKGSRSGPRPKTVHKLMYARKLRKAKFTLRQIGRVIGMTQQGVSAMFKIHGVES